jgi:hypothetical protein
VGFSRNLLGKKFESKRPKKLDATQTPPKNRPSVSGNLIPLIGDSEMCKHFCSHTTLPMSVCSSFAVVGCGASRTAARF